MAAERDAPKARAVGMNHVALEVGDVAAALDFYGRIFALELRGRGPGRAFVDMGDQFIALMETEGAAAGAGRDEHRHLGLVVDDREAVRRALMAMDDAEVLPTAGLDFRDPWGNRIQVVDYRDVQFTKAPEVLEAMGLGHLEKTEEARTQLARKGVRVRP